VDVCGCLSVCCECCVLSGIGLCDKLITRSEESYRLWYVVSELETSRMRRPCPTGGCCAKIKKSIKEYRRDGLFNAVGRDKISVQET
jgi:hypothetical protein